MASHRHPTASAPRMASASVAAVIAAFGPQPVRAEDLVLRKDIRVSGEVVRLGDVFENAGALADQPVFGAPDLGQTGFVSVDRLAAAARTLGLSWQPGEAFERISIARDAIVIDGATITTLIDSHVAETRTANPGTHHEVHVQNLAAPLLMPAGGDGIAVKDFDFDERSGRFRAVIGPKGAPDARFDRALSGRLVTFQKRLGLARAIDRGEILSLEHLEDQTVEVSANTIADGMDPVSLIGLSARRRLQPGQPLRAADFEPAKLITRNSLVLIIYARPGLQLTTEGRALADGAKGEVIAVLNTQSKRTVQAEVVREGLVRVAGSGMPDPAITTSATGAR